MKHILLLLMTPLLLTRFAAVSGNKMSKNESEAQTYLKLYTTVTGTADNRQENWLLANNGTRRIITTVEIVGTADDGNAYKKKKNVIVEPKTSVSLGLRSLNGSSPNNIFIIKAGFTPSSS